VHFKAVSTLPVTVPANPGTAPFIIAYFPDTNSVSSYDRTQGSWFSPQVFESGNPLPRYDSLIGWALPTLSVSDANNSTLAAEILPMDDGRSLEIILPLNLAAPVNFELFNALGQNVLQTTLPEGTRSIDASDLPRGVYFYRLTSGALSQSGKVILGE
jgi:hypothetical protein